MSRPDARVRRGPLTGGRTRRSPLYDERQTPLSAVRRATGQSRSPPSLRTYTLRVQRMHPRCTLAYLLERIVEIEANVPFEQVRKLFGRTRAAELHFDKQVVWEAGKVSPDALRILKALKIPAPPRVLRPAKP